MKLTWIKAILLGAAVLALFAHLYTKSSEVSVAEYDRYEDGLDRLKELDTAFNVDVLKTRCHLLNNYDGFAEQLRESSQTLNDLRRVPGFVTPAGQSRLGLALTNFFRLLTEKQECIEEFKIQNSVVRNSLAYFLTAGSELVRKAGAAPDGRELQLSFDELMRLILVYSLTAQEELEPQIQASIGRVRAWADANPSHADTDLVLSLILNARTLLLRKPKVDELTNRLVSLPTFTEADAMLRTCQDEFDRALQITQTYRLALFLCCVVLLGGIAWAGLALRQSNLHLEHRVRERTRELSGKNAELQGEITQRQCAERAVRQREMFLNAILNSLTANIAVFDCAGTIVAVNHSWGSFARSNGDTDGRKTGVGANYLETCRAAQAEDPHALHAADGIQAVLDGRLPEFSLEYPCHSASEKRWFLMYVTPLSGGRDGAVVSHLNITARKKAEEERKSMEIHLRHAQKMESIGQLAAGIAHEINTPTQYIGDNTRFLKDAFTDLLEVVEGYQQLLSAARQRQLTDEMLDKVESKNQKADLGYLAQEVPNAIRQSLDGVDRVSKIVRAMKEFSHPGTGEKTPIDLNHAIESTLTVCHAEWKYVAEVVTEYDSELPLVCCLPGEINQTILNLIVNASHAIADVVGDGGRGKGAIKVSTHRDGDWVEVRIRDTGTGIPEKARGRVFDPFFTTKAVGKGTGQGLAIAYSVVVEKHGGTIAFETETGKGTTFIIRLPLTSQAIGTERKAA